MVILHKTLHEFRRSKKQRLILKIDFEKAYDRVRWDFLEQVMIGRNFHPTWVKWVMESVKGDKVCINVNGVRSNYFSTYRGLRQGILSLPSFLTLWQMCWQLIKVT